MKNLIRYSDPEKDRQTLFVWPEGVFSGYSYDQIFILKRKPLNSLEIIF